MTRSLPVVARTVEEHRAAVLSGAVAGPPEERAVPDALDLVLAEDVASAVDLPAFDNSAMDGYALHADDLAGGGPLDLPVVDDVPAGGVPRRPVVPGTAVRVMTGAPVPDGTGAVVPVEQTDAEALQTLRHAVTPADRLSPTCRAGRVPAHSSCPG